jgi:putative ABC transport system permease protein
MDVRLPEQDKSQTAHASIAEISSGYFDVLRIPLLLGRTFTANDAGRPVVLVNQRLANRYWPEQNPIGKALVIGPERREVVGVVGDARTESMHGVLPAVYILPVRPFIPNVLIRDDGRTSATMAALVGRIDPQARVSVERLDTNIGRKLRPARVGAITAGAIGVLGLVLATIGLSGVFAYSVQQRTREIGIRMALGARAADVVRLVLGSSSRAVLLGTVLGVLGAMAASRLLGSHLYGLSPLDPSVYAGVALLLSLAVATASYLPARRAIRVDPTVALRYE